MNLITKKNSCGWKFPHHPPSPPITFFNGPSLIHFVIKLSTPLFSSKEIKFQSDE